MELHGAQEEPEEGEVVTLDLPSLRKRLDELAAAQAGSKADWSDLMDSLGATFIHHGYELLRAAEERDALLAACDAKNALLACYRIGKSPSEALQKRLDKANEAIRLAKEPR